MQVVFLVAVLFECRIAMRRCGALEGKISKTSSLGTAQLVNYSFSSISV